VLGDSGALCQDWGWALCRDVCVWFTAQNVCVGMAVGGQGVGRWAGAEERWHMLLGLASVLACWCMVWLGVFAASCL
jgi:hypothetical protein